MQPTTHNTNTTNTSVFNGGFTFVETLVAISVLLVAVAGPLFLASQGLRAARIARDQISANYLAQEAVEYVRFRRDNNALQGNTWLTGLSLCTTGCTIDIYTNDIAACPVGTECPVLFQEDTGKYGYGSGAGSEEEWIETKFTRWILIDEAVANQEAQLEVTISWQDGAIERQYTITETLMNWQ
ncbi:MAG: hypothetical protein AMXMBFR44_6600 [Candidatus Campbellbacteria bacterium]